MKRPEKYEHPEIYPNCYVYKCTDIDPLLDELEQLKAEKKPFPNYEEFEKWWDNMI
jgi:hypothetical protein